MANPAQLAAQIKFALAQIPAENAQHQFEHICRHLTQQFICSNVLPATGSVSAGGDQGRDFETFRSYLATELGPHGAFLGLVSEGTVAFVCTTQADGLVAKVRSDIDKVCDSGHPVHEVRAFTLNPVPIGRRHALVDEVQEAHGIRLEFHDIESIAGLLARSEGFWIAEQYLALPAELRPDAPPDDGDLPETYLERRGLWREQRVEDATLAVFLDLKAGLRESVYSEAARNDLPFWLGLMRELLARPDLSAETQQRARYELIVATLRGTGEMRLVDDVARTYLDGSLTETEPARLDDACTLLMYACGAALRGVTTIRSDDLDRWSGALAERIEELVLNETPHRRAALLSALGFLGLHPVLSEDDLPEPGSSPAEIDAPPWALIESTLTREYEYRDPVRALSAFTELMDRLGEAPLFPLHTLALIVQFHMPLWSIQAEWRELLERIDIETGARGGKSIVAERARDRAMALMADNQVLLALEELHRAQVEWWSGDTLRGSVLASLMIAQLYRELRLYEVAKAYALAAAVTAANDSDGGLVDLAPRGLLFAASCEFLSGAWCSAAELYDLALVAQHEVGRGGVNLDEDTMVQEAMLHLGYILLCARHTSPELASEIESLVERSGVLDLISELVDDRPERLADSLQSFGEGELSNRPFSDTGDTKCIRFAALGTSWTLLTDNDDETVLIAERFAAGVQAMLAALAHEDLCLVPTAITVRIEVRQQHAPAAPERIEARPSNDGREWVVRLAPTGAQSSPDLEEVHADLLGALFVILREASLLPGDDLSSAMDRGFQRGLGNRLMTAVQLEQFVDTFAVEQRNGFDRRTVEMPWNSLEGTLSEHEELRWQDSPSPTYSKDTANELLHYRYRTVPQSLRITLTRLLATRQFLLVVARLRSEGWLDWHILTAAMNIALNYRLASSGPMPPSAERMKEASQTPIPAGPRPLQTDPQPAVIPPKREGPSFLQLGMDTGMTMCPMWTRSCRVTRQAARSSSRPERFPT
ncbi:hypothetical protein [Candidatus Poriferisodalis sp.]|uniref:hypothetical protein n=1 Tax=Candidatus Poriferisodalis sp. TaxID=3101277 RepID=UPI003B5C9843